MTAQPEVQPMTAEQASLFGDEDRLDRLTAQFHAIPGWPADSVRDRQLAADLMRQYPRLELAEQVTLYAIYLRDLNSRKKVNHRARFANWCSIANNRRRSGRAQPGHASQRPRSAGTSAGGAPAGRDTFGDQSGYRGWS